MRAKTWVLISALFLSLLSTAAMGTELRNAYIRGASAPWGQSTNEAAMDAAFGAGNWDDLRMSGGAGPFMAGSIYKFVFLEGGDGTANELNAFLTAHRTHIEDFVARGGKLLLNSAPNEGSNIDFGFGVMLTYPSYSPSVTAANPAHPIFSGLPTAYAGNYFGHAIVGATTPIIVSENLVVLGEKTHGNGCALFGGMTTTNWHGPQPAAFNLRVNILKYTESGCTGGQKTLPENIACAKINIGGLGAPQEITGPAQRNLMLLNLDNVLRYQGSHRSLALSLLNSVILRTNGCALRGMPDSLVLHGGTEQDWILSCNAQATIYICLVDARSQLTGPVNGNH